MKSTLPTLLIIALLGACSSPETETTPDASDAMLLQAGGLVASTTFETLSGNLSQALSEGGVPQAIEFCSVEAIPLTEQLSSEMDVEVRRASHRPRNPDNRADAQEMGSIDSYLSRLDADEALAPRLMREGEDVLFHAPIRIPGPACIQCHGDPGTDITEADLELIQSRYPNDQATGFAIGDLRGIWSVRMPADSASVQEIIDMLDG
ncbi:MAG: c-type heme family protein [Bacteroidota bacterium]